MRPSFSTCPPPPPRVIQKGSKGTRSTNTNKPVLARHQAGTLSTVVSCHAPPKTNRYPEVDVICSLLQMENLRLVQGHRLVKWQRQDSDPSPIWPHGASHPNISTCLTMTLLFQVQQWTPQLPPVLLGPPHHHAIGPEPACPAHSTQTRSAGCPIICHLWGSPACSSSEN